MDLRLSWDLFIIVFFGIVVAYSFIIGRNNNLKVILATYISALGADAIGNLFANTLGLSDSFMKLMKIFYINTPVEAVVLIKILFFMTFIVILSVRGAYSVSVVNGGSAGVRMLVNLVFGFLNACLIVSIVLVFISGASFIVGGMGASPAFQDIYNQSNLAKVLVNHYSIWFLLPAASFLVMSLITTRRTNEAQ
ncbi:hypothetical protein JW911_04725 [Candidatus Peregrinibacteria bacterium]|nr:hypothetical protein [Candidatus Peregrinibacteria bacterium]